MLEEIKKFHVDPSGNVKKTVQKLNLAWIKFRGWPHFIHAKFNPRKVFDECFSKKKHKIIQHQFEIIS